MGGRTRWMRALGRAVVKLLSLIDELVALALALAGLALAVVLAVGRASVIEVGLVVLLTAAVLARWSYSSNVRDRLRRRP